MNRASCLTAALLALASSSCGGSSPPSAASSTQPPTEPASGEARCRVELEGGFEMYAFDARGRVVQRSSTYETGERWREAVEYDERGRVARIDAERAGGAGEVEPQPPVIPEYTEDASARTVEVVYPEHAEGPQHVVWTYDEAGRPTQREEIRDSGATYSMQCEYDDQGRLLRNSLMRYHYEGDATLPDLISLGGEALEVRGHGTSIEVRYVDRDPADPLGEDELDLSGDCLDVLMRPCSPIFAPPPPGGERYVLPGS